MSGLRAQGPRAAFEMLAGLIMPSGASWGSVATTVQRVDARAMFGQRVRRHWMGRPRGFSKTTDHAAMSVVAMLTLLVPGSQCFAVARDRDQARLVIDAMRGFIRRSNLEGAFESIGQYVIVARNGTRFEALSCDVGSAWGLTPAWVICDELAQWPEQQSSRDLFDAIVSSLPKVADSRFAIITTAGSPGHFSKEIFDRSVVEESWRVSMVHTSPPWMDPVEIEELRRSLPAPSYSRLVENRWAQGLDRLFAPADIDVCTVLPGPLGYDQRYSYRIAIDLALRNDRAVVGVGHVESGALVVDRMDVFEPSKGRDIDLSAVEDLIAARSREYRCAALFDPAMAGSMMQQLRRRGVITKEHTFTAASNSRRVMLLLQLSREHRMRLPDDRELRDELLNVRIRETNTPNVWRHDHDPSRHDDRVTVLGLLALLCESNVGPGRASGPPSHAPIGKPRSKFSEAPGGPQMLTFADGSRRRIIPGSIQQRLGGRR